MKENTRKSQYTGEIIWGRKSARCPGYEEAALVTSNSKKNSIPNIDNRKSNRYGCRVAICFMATNLCDMRQGSWSVAYGYW